MANAFMPSAFSSLNAAGQGTLEQLMKQRLFEQQMQQQQFGMQRQFNADQEMARRADWQQTYQQGMLERYEQDRLSRERLGQAELAAEQAAAARTQEGQLRVAELMRAGDFDGALAMAAQYGLTPPRVPTRVKTPDDLRAEEKAKQLGRGDAWAENPSLRPRRGTGGVKVAKDDPGAPRQFKAVIAARKGTAGWATIDQAVASLNEKWDEWRRNYPDLELSAAITALANIYGARPKSANSLFAASGAPVPDDDDN